MTMYKVLHPRDNIDRQYVLRKEEERELSNTDDSVDASVRQLKDYIKKKD